MINTQNKDYKESLKWFLVIYLHPADKNQARIRRNGKDFARKFELKDSELEIFTKYRKKNSISISVFSYENKEKIPIYISKINFKS